MCKQQDEETARVSRALKHQAPRQCYRCERVADFDACLLAYKCPGGHQRKCECEECVFSREAGRKPG